MQGMPIDRLHVAQREWTMRVMHSHLASKLPPAGAPRGAGSPIVLADGRAVELAPIDPRDAAAERAFIGALSLASRYRRFHFGLRELSPEQARAMTEIDPHHHVAFVARPLGSSTIVADARYVLRADSAEAEFAVAVADEWQSAGLGRELLRRLAAHARTQGVRRLFGDVLWGNGPMLALARQLGAQLARCPGDATLVRVAFAFEEARSPP
jgi:acetyltransferase